MTTRRWLGIAFLAMVLLVGGVLVADEMRLARVRAPMTKEDVRTSLGAPTQTIGKQQLTTEHLPLDSSCARKGIDEAFIYKRKFRNSLYVYFDAAGRVRCTERNFLIVQY